MQTQDDSNHADNDSIDDGPCCSKYARCYKENDNLATKRFRMDARSKISMNDEFLSKLSPKIRDMVKRANICTAFDILMTSKTKILDRNIRTPVFYNFRKQIPGSDVNKCTAEDVRILKAAAAKIVALEEPTTVLKLLQSPRLAQWSRISYGCTALDNCTNGGVVTRGITEICGAAGTGKTQLLLQLSLTVQLPKSLGGLGKAVAYICTEDQFPSKRLLEISKSFNERYPEHDINYLGNIFIEHIYEAPNLLSCVTQRLAKLMENVSIGLIIIDSVAAIFRLYTNYIKRACDMRKMVNALLGYADKYNCAVICVNQVTSNLKLAKDLPCLGLAWAHLGRTRIRLTKETKMVKINGDLFVVRKLEVLYSPESPSEFAEFVVTTEGIVNNPKAEIKK